MFISKKELKELHRRLGELENSKRYVDRDLQMLKSENANALKRTRMILEFLDVRLEIKPESTKLVKNKQGGATSTRKAVKQKGDDFKTKSVKI
jgi:hypothetical protein